MHLHEFVDALPLAALTCIDPRLNKLFPGALGLNEEQFIWLRNAGNVITSATSSTVRSLALSIFVKEAKEIAVIGHSDCKMSKLTMMDMLTRMQQHGIDRSMINQANLHEFFGLFSSETQNVIKGVGYLRESPYIPKKMPVHGLIIQTDTGKLDWVVNGYQAGGLPLATSDGAPETVDIGPAAPVNVSGYVAGPAKSLMENIEPLLGQKIEAAASELVEKLVEQIKPPKISPPVNPAASKKPQMKLRDRGPFR
jgi:carbonic anhydrase